MGTWLPTRISLELLAKVVDVSLASVVITDRNLDKPGPIIVHVNPAFTHMTGYSFKEVIGRTPRLLQGPKTDRTVLDEIRLRLSRNEVFAGQAVNYRKDGSTFINEWHIEPIIEQDGQFHYYLAVQRDVTKDQAVPMENNPQLIYKVLEWVEQEKRQLCDEIALNIKDVLLPLLKIDSRKMSLDKGYLFKLEKLIQELNTVFGRGLIEQRFGLSPREAQVAKLIRQGLPTKTIAQTLNITIGTTELHRKKIRYKLGITNAKQNLTNYLRAL